MRILRVHNAYQQRGGEDVSFETEVAMLRGHGEHVETLVLYNEAIPENLSLNKRIQLGIDTIWSKSGHAHVAKQAKAFQPEVVHFDNTFPLISPSAYSAARSQGAAVVQSLRNYRLICPSANLYRDDRPCTDCVGRVPWPGVRHRCYHHSAVQTGVVASMLALHRARRTWTDEVDRYIALTEFVRDVHVRAGIPGELIMVKPNSVSMGELPQVHRTSAFVFVGRLSREKGIRTLLRAWRHVSLPRLDIIGDGPEVDEVIDAANEHPANIHYQRRLSESDSYLLMAGASAVIVPSEWYEPFGRVVIEAFAHGTPVIAAKTGGLVELVEEGVTGLLFEPGNAEQLRERVRWAEQHPVEVRRMGESARRVYEEKFTPERNYDQLMEIYGAAIGQRHLT